MINFDDEDVNLIESFGRNNKIPIIRDESASFLMDKIKELKPSDILEVGTAIGYSGILMLNNCNGTLITIEKDEEKSKIAKENFEKLGLLDRVSLINNDALVAIKDLLKDNKKFDFIFLDGPKAQYFNYYPYLFSLLKINGVMFCDNVLFRGLVEKQGEPDRKYRTIIKNLRKFNELCLTDKKYCSELYHIEDGIMICKKVEN
jgi:predicted O-methyltransferase YrrM